MDAYGPRAAQQLLERARERVQARGARHAGDLTPAETARLLHARAVTVVDVRSHAELALAGGVPGARHIEWPVGESPEPRRRFIDAIAALAAQGAPVVMLCRSGVRSENAACAAAEAGLASIFNMLEGFEGVADAQGRRSRVNGWRHAGLPCIAHEGAAQ